MSYFLIKRNTEFFKELTLVKYEVSSYSGNCYLVSDLNDTYKREWIIHYDLYKLIDKNDTNEFCYYNEYYDKIMRELISKL